MSNSKEETKINRSYNYFSIFILIYFRKSHKKIEDRSELYKISHKRDSKNSNKRVVDISSTIKSSNSDRSSVSKESEKHKNRHTSHAESNKKKAKIKSGKKEEKPKPIPIEFFARKTQKKMKNPDPHSSSSSEEENILKKYQYKRKRDESSKSSSQSSSSEKSEKMIKYEKINKNKNKDKEKEKEKKEKTKLSNFNDAPRKRLKPNHEFAEKIKNSSEKEEIVKKRSYSQEKETHKKKIIPEKGNFIHGDKARQIISSKLKDGELICLIEWWPRKNGITPENSSFSNTFIKQYDPVLLINYYEKNIPKLKKCIIKLLNC